MATATAKRAPKAKAKATTAPATTAPATTAPATTAPASVPQPAAQQPTPKLPRGIPASAKLTLAGCKPYSPRANTMHSTTAQWAAVCAGIQAGHTVGHMCNTLQLSGGTGAFIGYVVRRSWAAVQQA